MAEHTEPIPDKVSHIRHEQSSSSDSDDHKTEHSSSSSAKSRAYRLFRREKPVHQILGGGTTADVFLWRNRKTSAVLLLVTTVMWILFDPLDYHLIPLVCYVFISILSILFLWSNGIALIKKSPPHIPEISIPEDLTLKVALSLRCEINKALAVLREVLSGRDLKKFLVLIAGLWLLSIIGSSFGSLTLSYIVFVLLLTIPKIYERYGDKVDCYCEKLIAQLEKHYILVRAKAMSKFPRSSKKDKKYH